MAHVLLVDDDIELLAALTMLLEGEGHRVEVAANGAEAWRILSTGAVPDVVLLDLFMPVMDGWTLLSHLRDRPELKPARIVVMSSVACATDVTDSSVIFVRKPLCVDALLDIVTQIDARSPNPPRPPETSPATSQ